MAEIGLNLFQILQNELLSRETSRGNLSLGLRFASIVERQKNTSAVSHNSRVWGGKPRSGARQCAHVINFPELLYVVRKPTSAVRLNLSRASHAFLSDAGMYSLKK